MIQEGGQKMRKRLVTISMLLLLITAATPLFVLAELKEDIINFSYQNAQVVSANGSWKVAVGKMWLLDFGPNQQQAEQALQIIRHYRLNQQCFVGRPQPSMQYYLSNSRAPVGQFPGEDSIHFDNTKLRVVNVRNRWKIIELPSHMMLDFDQNEQEAWTALRIIWKYDFSYICFVGRPNAPMIYFRR